MKTVAFVTLSLLGCVTTAMAAEREQDMTLANTFNDRDAKLAAPPYLNDEQRARGMPTTSRGMQNSAPRTCRGTTSYAGVTNATCTTTSAPSRRWTRPWDGCCSIWTTKASPRTRWSSSPPTRGTAIWAIQATRSSRRRTLTRLRLRPQARHWAQSGAVAPRPIRHAVGRVVAGRPLQQLRPPFDCNFVPAAKSGGSDEAKRKAKSPRRAKTKP